MNNNSELINQYKDAFPAFGGYMECMSRTLLTGLSSFCLAFGGTYVTQHLTSKYLPYGRKNHIIVSSLIACAVAYKVTSVRARACQAGWMAAEDKHTYLNPISEREKVVELEEE
ncbi:uncharacterized protein LOC122249411 [Penaeus japonicus]|uniref:uncharacterized protein LOC122249411 n=1 Tax=Penaeus japonicus TaxID=27405 RepID=UPI001C71709D|nr:uncharacterized protein LOC122249411 [Penaeus japonicus]XP_042866172.1 uncharacterized protein LOC122249411 [Penaeus japonicus]